MSEVQVFRVAGMALQQLSSGLRPAWLQRKAVEAQQVAVQTVAVEALTLAALEVLKTEALEALTAAVGAQESFVVLLTHKHPPLEKMATETGPEDEEQL